MSRSLYDLDPAFYPIACRLIAALIERNLAIMIVDTLRTPEEHTANVAAGRSWTINSKHLAQPDCGKSHAIDLAPYSQFNLYGPDKLQWDAADPAWKVIGEEAVKLGLRWGGTWAVRATPPYSKNYDPGHAEWLGI